MFRKHDYSFVKFSNYTWRPCGVWSPALQQGPGCARAPCTRRGWRAACALRKHLPLCSGLAGGQAQKGCRGHGALQLGVQQSTGCECPSAGVAAPGPVPACKPQRENALTAMREETMDSATRATGDPLYPPDRKRMDLQQCIKDTFWKLELF